MSQLPLHHHRSLMPALPLAGWALAEGEGVRKAVSGPWLLQSRLPANRQVVKHRGSDWLPKPQEWVETSSLQAWHQGTPWNWKVCEVLWPDLQTSPQGLVRELAQDFRQICASRVQLLVLCRRQVRPVRLAFLKTPACLSMLNLWQLCQKTTSYHATHVKNVVKNPLWEIFQYLKKKIISSCYW